MRFVGENLADHQQIGVVSEKYMSKLKVKQKVKHMLQYLPEMAKIALIENLLQTSSHHRVF